ncbi:biogenesis of lysosome-related organelles complex 1 subunit 4-like isoform X3 [Hyperolius riggenbachi]|uniref:biogenesis of lysosome-related organelles complex 1 subunit 4-like isoform X3 n=1 Tax=Hyperolius riggenbachi TaxID=752182 RepID=UPI0035A31B4C
MALDVSAGLWEAQAAMEMEEGEGAAHRSPGDSGHVSQSHSVCSAASIALLYDEEVAFSDSTLRNTANQLSTYILPAHHKTEIRNDTSQVVNEKVPQIYTKAAEMRRLYQKIDVLETFVKKVGSDVALMEEQVTQAETNLGTFPNPLKKIFQNLSSSPLFSPTKTASSPRPQQVRYESPTMFKTEDYFPSSS